MKQVRVIHPFLFAIFPILFLFVHNIAMVPPKELFMPLVTVICFTLLLSVLFNLILKNKKKAGALLSLCFVFFFSYGYLFTLIMDFLEGKWGFRQLYFALFWGTLFIVIAYCIIKTLRNLYTLTIFLNIVAATLIVISLINMGGYVLKIKLASHDDNQNQQNVTVDIINLKKPDTPPDIYYIILDGYASSNTLEEIFSYDNHEFTDNLISKDFYIASESQANQRSSVGSMTSSLNMTCLDDEEQQNWKLLLSMIENNKVMLSLKAIGYRYIHFSSTSGYLPTRNNKHADIIFKGKFWGSEFNMVLIETTLMKLFLTRLGTMHRQRILSTFEQLAAIPDEIESPFFAFAHLVTPHPPYFFNRNGEGLKTNVVITTLKDYWEPRDKYLDQLIFINKKLKILVDEILSKSENPPIIILQADHGPRFNDSSLENKMGILNAYYLPKPGNSFLYQSISPINSFRVIFNLYFATNLELLDDKSCKW